MSRHMCKSATKSDPYRWPGVAVSFGTERTRGAWFSTVPLQQRDTQRSITHSYKGYKEIQRGAIKEEECGCERTRAPCSLMGFRILYIQCNTSTQREAKASTHSLGFMNGD